MYLHPNFKVHRNGTFGPVHGRRRMEPRPQLAARRRRLQQLAVRPGAPRDASAVPGGREPSEV